MKRIIFLLTAIFMCIGARAKTETINWYMDGNTYAATQCETGSDIILPQTPYKYGYTFNGWFGYTPIEYLEFTGTQWIDTGYAITSNVNSGFNIKYSFTSIRNHTGIIGSQTASDNNWFFNPFFNDSINNYNLYIGSSSRASSNIPITSGIVNNMFCKTLPGNKWTSIVNNQSYNGSFYGTIVSGQSVYLFTTGSSDINSVVIPRIVKGRIYSCQIYDNDVLVRDFIPVLDPSGVPCMYDKVEDKFYYNAGTGQFIAGPVIGGE